MNAPSSISRIAMDYARNAKSGPIRPMTYELLTISEKVILDHRIGGMRFQYVECSAIALPKNQ